MNRANLYGVNEETCKAGSFAPSSGFQKLGGELLTHEEEAQRNALIRRVAQQGYRQTMEEAAYTWFNRFVALRYMQEHQLLPVSQRVLPEMPGQMPEIIREAHQLSLDGVDAMRVLELLDRNESTALYRYLLIILCNALHEPLPQMFEKISDYTELLFPDGLLKDDSVLAALSGISSEDFQDIQVIDWLYQYYNTELKNETFELLKKNVKITKERIGYKSSYARLIEPTTQAGKEEMFLAETNRYTAQQENFKKIPGMPVAYWVSSAVYEAFKHKTIEDIADMRHGLSTGKNEIFVKHWSEVTFDTIDVSMTCQNDLSHSIGKYFPYNKGSDDRKWYGNAEYVLWYDLEGQEVMRSLSGHRHDGRERYFQEGITWPFISSSNFGVRYTPTGFAFDVGGSSMFSDHRTVIYLTGLLCSKLGQYFMSIQNPTLNFQVGNLKNVPVIPSTSIHIAEEVENCIGLSKDDWDSFEISWNFKKHPLI